ncbi:MAG TPA: hypothetical protein PLA94_31890, partial [Myxococcota bacterium]|nr:hypothetical protein [Myxococcota bacterium]
MNLRLTSGGAALTLSGDLEGMARRILERSSRGAGKLLLQVAEDVQGSASSRWYQQVRRRTGKSGHIVSTLEIRDDSAIVRVGSTDDRVGKGGKPSVVFVRRPGALSIIERPATDAEYHARRSSGMKAGEAYWIKDKPNPLAADGGFLLLELVRRPFRA